MNDSLKAALWTTLFSFIGTVLVALTGLLFAVNGWVNGADTDLSDDVSNFARIAMSALIAAVIGLVNFIIRWAQSKNVLPGRGPVYFTDPPAGDRHDGPDLAPRRDLGESTLVVLVCVAVIVLVVLVVVGRV